MGPTGHDSPSHYLNNWWTTTLMYIYNTWGRFKNAYKLVNRRARIFSPSIKSISFNVWVRYFVWDTLKFHTISQWVTCKTIPHRCRKTNLATSFEKFNQKLQAFKHSLLNRNPFYMLIKPTLSNIYQLRWNETELSRNRLPLMNLYDL